MLPYQHLCICLNLTLYSTADRDTASWRPENRVVVPTLLLWNLRCGAHGQLVLRV